ncbi:hypothetical protein BJ973_004184 [Actinoplanes tereljensis]|uniref:Ricin B lectin domain-containing protein n=1 Tax=Paractinoplanes tereljensis TaxID=571912 RepID=A0A919NR69_9ACTN|nr:hypothetical protein [Actinoplanes tereljensis]GIF23575.1 hypothetical protein Ate02nite_63050 [Actinoplanes tereljensis]
MEGSRFARIFALGAISVLTAALAACGEDDTPAEAAATSASAPAALPATTTPEPEPTSTTTAAPTKTATTKPATAKPTTAKPGAESDLSQLKSLGIDVEVGMIIDVADDGLDRYLQVGKNGVVDFTGTTRTDSTMMSLKPAAVSAKNRVTIKPPFWNEDTGAGSCVADTAGTALKLETCQAGKASQTWQVVPAGDSGQFELRGAFGILNVDNGKLVASGGYTGLQTLDFAG